MMKTRITLFLLLASVLMATGQNEIGFRIGGHYNDTQVEGFIPSLTPSTYYQNGFSGGVFYKIAALNNFSFTPALQYTQKGFAMDEGTHVDVLGIELPVGVRAETRMDYVEAPVLVRYTIPKGIAEFYAEVGPTLGYAVKGQVKSKATAIFDFNVATTDLDLSKDRYQRWEISGNIGVGVALQAGQGKVFFDGRYVHGFTDMIDNPTIDVRMKNRGFTYAIGYSIPLTSKQKTTYPNRV